MLEFIADVVSIISLFLISGLSGWAGWLFKTRQVKRELKKPICGCNHHISFHKGNKCYGMKKVVTKWDPWGDPIAWDYERCTCQRYVGPDEYLLMETEGIQTQNRLTP